MAGLEKRCNPATMRLLIHHHDIAHLDSDGEIWLGSGIGRWVKALAEHFASIGLLLHESAARVSGQDTPIARDNVELLGLGPPGHYWDRLQRMRRIRRVCRQAGAGADGLLIRGMTPRQYTVWRNTDTPNKAFLLVRSPRQKRLIKASVTSLIAAVVNRHREREYRRILQSNIVPLANSPTYIGEIEAIAGKQAFYVPTSTIGLDEFAPLAVRPLSSKIRILFVGRLNYLKGVRELLGALAALREQGYDCVLDIVARRVEPEFAQLGEMAREAGIDAAVNWRGFVPFGEELLTFYRKADVFVLPSYTEGMPRVLWEAAANCLPIVATNVGGIPSFFQNGEHALLVPPQDATAVADAIRRLVDSNELRENLVTSAYALASESSVEASARRMAERLAMEWSNSG